MDDENLREENYFRSSIILLWIASILQFDGKSLLLADESDRSVRCGLNAPPLHTSMAMIKVCDLDKALSLTIVNGMKSHADFRQLKGYL